MNTTSYVLTTSGFILPHTPHHNPLSPDLVEDNSIFNKKVTITTNSDIAEFVKSKLIYHSETANLAYRAYEADKSFNNYINLVNIAIDVLSKVNYDMFFEIQANNRNMSPVSFMFCLDFYSGCFVNKYLQYATVPFSVRFSSANNLTESTIAKNISLLKTNRNTYRNTWDSKIAELADNKDAFLTFFKYIFVDTYE